MKQIAAGIKNLLQGKRLEFIKFAIVGGSGVIVNMGLLYVLTHIFSMQVAIASPIAIEVSIITNFTLNNLWTFKEREVRFTFWARLLRYHMVTGVAGLVNYVILLLLVKYFEMYELLANLIGIVAGMFINFVLNSLWTWKERSS